MNHKLPIVFSSLLFAASFASAEIAIEDSWGKAQFYGSIRVLITDEDSTPSEEANGIDRQTDIADGISRIGLRGYVNLTDGWQGVYRLEGRVLADSGEILSEDNDFHRRVTYIGMKHQDVGEFRIGKQFSPHYLWTILPIDITLHNPRHYNIRWNASENSSIREANSVAYFSPKLGGFSLAALAEIDGNDSESSGVDSYNLAAKYNNGPWQVGVSYFDRADDIRINGAERPDAETFAATVQYKKGVHKAVIRYQDEDIVDDTEFTTIGGYYSYQFAKAGIEAQARIYNLDNGVIDGNQIAVGITRKFGKRGQLFLEYVDYDEEAAILRGRGDDVTAGLRIDF